MPLGARRGETGAAVESHISVDGPEPDESLEQLAEWLRGEPELAGRVRPQAPPPRDGEMGAAAELLVVSLGAGGALSVLAGSLRAWLSQPRRSGIKVTVHRPDGQRLEIDARHVTKESVEEILRQALRAEEE